MIKHYTDLELRVRDFGRSIARKDEGATMVEYGLLVALIAVFLIGALTALGGGLDALFDNVTANL